MLLPSPASALPPPLRGRSWWRNLVEPQTNPPLSASLRLEFTRSLGDYFGPFMLGGPIAAVLGLAVAMSVGSVAALACIAICSLGLGFILFAVHQSRSPLDEDALATVEDRYCLGLVMASAGMGGVIVSVLTSPASLQAQAVVVMVALAVLGISNGAGPGRPLVAAAQAITVTLPTGIVLMLKWGWPWGIAAGPGVFAYGALCFVIAHRSYLTQTQLILARETQKAERLRMDVALQRLSQAMAILDPDLKVVLVNRSALDLLGVDALDPADPPQFAELMAGAPNLRRASGHRDEFLAHAALLQAARQPFNGVLRLNDDRVLDLECLPIPDAGWVVMLRDTTGERNAIAELNREIRRCPLTGLANRRAFLEELERRLGRGEALTLLLIDIDGFKQVNDRHGHGVGDRMLTRLGFRLRTADPSLYVARLGGDEFALISDAPDAEAALALGQRLIEVIEPTAVIGEAEVHVGAAIGIARAPADAMFPEALLRCADLALLSAKSQPGSWVRAFTPDLMENAARRANVETRVRAALRSGQIDVAYQPLLDLASGRVIALEALARWHPDGGETISPDELVAIAEARGLVGQLRRLVLEQAASVVARLDPPLNLWINTSVHDLRQPGMVDEVLAELQLAGLPPSRVALEVTESALMTDEGTCLSNLQRFCAMGAGVAMDDFGAGFSSLDRLRRLPINALKISGSLLTGAPSDAAAADIFRVAAGLGHSMGLLLVAEGVEGESELALARAAGIDRVQGFALSPAVAADQVPAAIAAAEAAAARALARLPAAAAE